MRGILMKRSACRAVWSVLFLILVWAMPARAVSISIPYDQETVSFSYSYTPNADGNLDMSYLFTIEPDYQGQRYFIASEIIMCGFGLLSNHQGCNNSRFFYYCNSPQQFCSSGDGLLISVRKGYPVTVSLLMQGSGIAPALSFSGGGFFFGPTAVPLPATLPLLGAGIGAMGYVGWRRRRRAAN